jgi:protein-S-isoprenylcysteine O-methyltransferase Ste14
MLAEREAPDVASAGLVRPPFVYLAAILVGSALQIAWPLDFLPSGIAPLGAVLVAAAAALFVTSVRQFRAAGTPVPGDSPSTAVVERGPIASAGTRSCNGRTTSAPGSTSR